MVPFSKSDRALFECACHEGNRGLYNILHNARFAERGSRSSAPHRLASGAERLTHSRMCPLDRTRIRARGKPDLLTVPQRRCSKYPPAKPGALVCEPLKAA